MRQQEIEYKAKRMKERRTEEIKKQKRLNIAVNVIVTFIFQFMLIVMAFAEIFTNCIYY